jgi:hypothetical protein
MHPADTIETIEVDEEEYLALEGILDQAERLACPGHQQQQVKALLLLSGCSVLSWYRTLN